MKRVTLSLSLLLASACSPHSLRWEYVLPDASLEGSPMRAIVLDGGCTGTIHYERSFVDGESPDGPLLPAGTYGIELEVHDTMCNVVARACEEVTLPSSDATVRLTLMAVSPPSSFCPGACSMGMCAGGVDAGPTDAGMVDAARVDANVDAGPPVDANVDAGPPGVECGTSTDCPCGGDTCTDGRCVPTRPATVIAAGANHACAISGGHLFCWGTSLVGEVGLDWNSTVAVPTEIPDRTDWTTVDSQGQTTCGMAGGAVVCWGSNYTGQCGIDPMVRRDVFGEMMAAVVSVPITPAQLAVGGLQAFVIDSSGALAGWGDNGQEQISGPGAIAMDPMPPSVLGSDTWAEISSGTFFTCAVDTEGQLWCWGGDLGSVGALGGAECGGCPRRTVTDPTPSVAGTWAHVSLGIRHACAWTTDGALYCWGRNSAESDGAVGIGSSMNQLAPIRVPGLVAAEASLQNHTCVVDTSHALWCFGPNASGQLGVGDMDTHRDPARVAGDRWQHVAVGPDFTCATTLEGAVLCWGEGEGFVLGQDFSDEGDHATPTRVCLPM